MQGLLKLSSLALAVSLLLAASASGSGSRAFPGSNGPILVWGAFGENDAFATVRPGDSGPRRARHLNAYRYHAAWSPDGEALAVVQRGILRIGLDGSGRRRLTWGGTSPAWSPDGSAIAFVRADGLYVVDVVTRRQRRIFSAEGARVENPDWSPDGAEVAFAWREHIHAVGADGTRTRRITRDRQAPCSERLIAATWKPDGAELAAESIGTCPGFLPTVGVRLLRSDGTNERDLRQDGTETESAVWSPDGRSLVYSVTDEENTGRSWLALRRGGRTTTILEGEWYPVDWQPRCTKRGSSRRDRLVGSGRAELICGLGGNDTITGAPGRDRLFGEGGDDRFFARDSEFDVIGCGSGRDVVIADRADLVGRDCERVTRR